MPLVLLMLLHLLSLLPLLLLQCLRRRFLHMQQLPRAMQAAWALVEAAQAGV